MGNSIHVPYTARLPEQIRIGSSVIISGRPHLNCQTFSFNLCQGPALEAGEVLLHFNPRFHKCSVVCNSMHSGKWASESKQSYVPFTRNVDFVMEIKAEDHGYQMTVNGSKFCHFPYRLPKEMAQYFVIIGDVFISNIVYNGASLAMAKARAFAAPPQPKQSMTFQYPGAPPPYTAQPANPAVYNPSVPLTMSIPGGMFPGKIILISGMVINYHSSRFSVNLKCGPSEQNDGALHFDVRFRYGNDTNVVVRTHFQYGQWGREEREMTYFPFQIGHPFEIMILAETGCFKIAVNNQHFTHFAHRIHPLELASYLNIAGDVSINQIQFQ